MATQRIFYKVLYDFQAEEEGEMSVTQGTFVQTAGACSSYPVSTGTAAAGHTHKCFAGSPFISTGDAPGDPTPRSATRIHPCTHAFFPHALGSPPHSITHPSLTTTNKPVSHTTPLLTLPPLPSRTSLCISLSLKMRPRSPAPGGCSWRWYRTRASPGMCPSTM